LLRPAMVGVAKQASRPSEPDLAGTAG